jgi:hypothetical protein
MGCCVLKPKIPLVETITQNSPSKGNIPYYQLDEDSGAENVTQPKKGDKPSSKHLKINLHINPHRVEERKIRKGNELASIRKAVSEEIPKRTSYKQTAVDQVNSPYTPISSPRRQGRSNTLPASLRTQISGMMAVPLVDQIKPKWQRDPNELPVATDLPRMIQNVMVSDDEHKVLFERSATKDKENGNTYNMRSRVTLLKELFLILAHRFTLHDLHSTILLRWSEFFDNEDLETSDLSQQLRKFLLQVVGNQNALINILKSVNQSVIAPVAMRIRSFFFGEYNLKDVRNAWNVDILLANGEIIVRHLKWEESIPTCFKFQWKLDLVFNEDATELMDTRLEIPILQFAENIQNTEEQKVRHIIVDILNVTPRA